MEDAWKERFRSQASLLHWGFDMRMKGCWISCDIIKNGAVAVWVWIEQAWSSTAGNRKGVKWHATLKIKFRSLNVEWNMAGQCVVELMGGKEGPQHMENKENWA